MQTFININDRRQKPERRDAALRDGGLLLSDWSGLKRCHKLRYLRSHKNC